MASTVTCSSPCSAARRSAAACRACRVAAFLRPRRLVGSSTVRRYGDTFYFTMSKLALWANPQQDARRNQFRGGGLIGLLRHIDEHRTGCHARAGLAPTETHRCEDTLEVAR